jgi:putative ABC transport system permease protein
MAKIIDFDKWQEIIESLKRHKLRTMLTAISVWWGIFMLIILLGAGSGLENSAKRDFEDDSMNTFFLYGGTTSKPYKGLKPGRNIFFDNEDYDMIANDVDGLKHTSGRFFMWGDNLTKYKEKALSFDLRTVHPEHAEIEKTIIVDGRFINNEDLKRFRKICVIGDLVKKELMPEVEDPVGTYVNIKGIDFMVVGVFTDAGWEGERKRIYLPITTAQKVFSGSDRVHQLLATFDSDDMEATLEMKKTLRANLAARHNFDRTDLQAISVWNNFENFKDFQTFFGMLKGFLWFVGIGSILAGVIGVSNIMLIIVKDRTREIGIRKALGATPRSIISMIVTESVFLTGISGYVGVLSGFGLIELLGYLMEKFEVELEFFYKPQVSPAIILTALFILIIAGVVAGYFPAKKAATISAVEAMNN